MERGLKYYLCVVGGQLMWPQMTIRYERGLYSFNGADADSPVLVTVDYYLTVHRVIESIEMQGLECHLLVVDGHGINVWCGSRGNHVNTESVLDAIEQTDLGSKVNHRQLILPQLMASSVSVTGLSEHGWMAAFGPVEIDDVGEFIANDFEKRPSQALVRFELRKRLEENVRHLTFETTMFVFMTPIFWLLAIMGGLFLSWFEFWLSRLLWIIFGSWVLGTFMAIADPVMPTTSGYIRGLITGVLALFVWKLLLFSHTAWFDTEGLTILGLALFVGFNWGGATPFLGEDQMLRDIIVGLLSLALLFVMGYYFPAGLL